MADPELVNYIKQHMNQYSIDQLRNTLLDHGYRREEVEEAIDVALSRGGGGRREERRKNTRTRDKRPKRKKKETRGGSSTSTALWIFLALVVLGSFAVGGYMFLPGSEGGEADGVLSKEGATSPEALIANMSSAAKNKDWDKTLTYIHPDERAFFVGITYAQAAVVVNLMATLGQKTGPRQKFQRIKEKYGLEGSGDGEKYAKRIKKLSEAENATRQIREIKTQLSESLKGKDLNSLLTDVMGLLNNISTKGQRETEMELDSGLKGGEIESIDKQNGKAVVTMKEGKPGVLLERNGRWYWSPVESKAYNQDQAASSDSSIKESSTDKAKPLGTTQKYTFGGNSLDVAVDDYKITQKYQYSLFGDMRTEEAGSGDKFLLLHMEISNTGDQKQTGDDLMINHRGINPDEDPLAGAPETSTYDSILLKGENHTLIDSNGEFEAGETKQGWVIYSVPENVSPDDTTAKFGNFGDSPRWDIG